MKEAEFACGISLSFKCSDTRPPECLNLTISDDSVDGKNKLSSLLGRRKGVGPPNRSGRDSAIYN